MRALYRVWTSALAADSVDRILRCAAQQASEEARTFTTAADLDAVRSATITWLDQSWIADLLSTYVEQANREDFQLDLDGGIETQLITYAGDRRDHYGWHHDVDWGADSARDRKLSVTVQLSAADDYTGGELEFADFSTNADFRSKGTVVVFPSVLRHRVRPVTAGTRHALVSWFSGPRWR